MFLINIIFKRCSSGENLVLQLFFLLQSEDFFGIVSNDHIARQQRENIEYIVKMKRQMSSWCTNKTSYEKRLIGQNVPQMKSPQTYMQYIRSYGNNALQAKGPIYRQNVLYLLYCT